jgi:S-adenosyl-L-methionine hydrolase (adenosine-forming)
VGTITLTTDFGTQDAFVGTMKGVIISRCPGAQLVDLTHEVPPQSIRIGALRVASAAPYFPVGTIHLVVVDPGVGGARRPVAIKAGGQGFVGPDNGVLSLAAPRSAPDWRAVELTSDAHRLPSVSNTFHGRDIFAPAAAHLACGGALEDLGDPIQSIVELAIPAPVRDGDVLHGVVLDVDRFGNLITNIRAADLAGAAVAEAVVGERRIEGLSRSYDSTRNAVVLIDSDDRLEIAVPGGNAAEAMGVGTDDPIEVRLLPRP